MHTEELIVYMYYKSIEKFYISVIIHIFFSPGLKSYIILPLPPNVTLFFFCYINFVLNTVCIISVKA